MNNYSPFDFNRNGRIDFTDRVLYHNIVTMNKDITAKPTHKPAPTQNQSSSKDSTDGVVTFFAICGLLILAIAIFAGIAL